MTDSCIRPAPQLPTRPVVCSTADARAALDRLAADTGLDLDPRVADALSHLIATTTGEVRSEDPASCRWLVTEHPHAPDRNGAYTEGRDTLAEALNTLAWALLSGDPAGSVTITLNPDTRGGR